MRYVDSDGGAWVLTEKHQALGHAVVKVQREGATRAEWLPAPKGWRRRPGVLVTRARHGQLRLVDD